MSKLNPLIKKQNSVGLKSVWTLCCDTQDWKCFCDFCGNSWHSGWSGCVLSTRGNQWQRLSWCLNWGEEQSAVWSQWASVHDSLGDFTSYYSLSDRKPLAQVWADVRETWRVQQECLWGSEKQTTSTKSSRHDGAILSKVTEQNRRRWRRRRGRRRRRSSCEACCDSQPAEQRLMLGKSSLRLNTQKCHTRFKFLSLISLNLTCENEAHIRPCKWDDPLSTITALKKAEMWLKGSFKGSTCWREK